VFLQEPGGLEWSDTRVLMCVLYYSESIKLHVLNCFSKIIELLQ